MKFRVQYEFRNPGAIGSFQRGYRDLKADDADDAKKIVFKDLHDQGLETRGFYITSHLGGQVK